MSGWIKADVFLGFPVKVFSIPACDLRWLQRGPLGYLQPDAEHFEAQCLALLGALELAGHIPSWASSVIIGIHRPSHQDTMEFTIMHPAFPRTEVGSAYPVVEVRLTAPAPTEAPA